jgi:hypothetical protein
MSDIIRAEISGENTCTALGITAHAPAPVLSLFRKLVDAGHDRSRPLHAYRGEVLCLKVRSIGEAAGLKVNSNGVGFARQEAMPAAPPVRPADVAAIPVPRRPGTFLRPLRNPQSATCSTRPSRRPTRATTSATGRAVTTCRRNRNFASRP